MNVDIDIYIARSYTLGVHGYRRVDVETVHTSRDAALGSLQGSFIKSPSQRTLTLYGAEILRYRLSWLQNSRGEISWGLGNRKKFIKIACWLLLLCPLLIKAAIPL